MTRPTASPAEPGILAPAYLWTTIGAFALIFLGAFETLAVTTIMPVISDDLDGEVLYAVAFSGTLAASVIGMVIAGRWSDRGGPVRPLVVAMVVFLAGLILAGVALNMGVFIAGRFLQGLGSGAISVALYVVVARIYPAALHPAIFGAFAAAWVLPSMIGPPVAGLVAEAFGWHWVFLGVGVLVVLAAGTIVPALRVLLAHPSEPSQSNTGRWSVLWSVIVAGAVLVISLSGEVEAGLAWPLAAVALAIAVVALLPLVPKGTLLARRGLPATILLRGAVAASFFATEVYLPYLLVERYGFESWASGLILTVGAVSWAIGSAVQGRFGARVNSDTIARLGSLLLVVGIGAQFATALLTLSPLVAAVGWFLAGGGMGLIFPRLSTLVLAYSTPSNQGFNSAALSITDAAGAATSIAFAGLIFTAVGAAAGAGFPGALALTTVLAIVAVPIAMRVRVRD